MPGRLWTLANGIMLAMFLLSVAVQYNDPDPLVWMGIYGAAALVCGLEIARRAPRWMAPAVALVALAWAASIYSRARDVPIASLFAQWEMRDLHVEEAREMYGLAIVAAWMIAVAIAGWRRARARRATVPASARR